MKKLLVATALAALMSTAVNAETIKLGVILGYTGPIESLTPDMAAGAELAIKEASKATIRRIPLEGEGQGPEKGICIFSGKPSTQRVLFAKNY